MKRKHISFNIPWPNFQANWSQWLPSRGNVVFSLLLFAIVIWVQRAGALAPTRTTNSSLNTISYQGRLADVNGDPLTGVYNLEFRLYDVPAGGAPLWEELWTGGNSVQVSDGLFNVMLGSLNPTLESAIDGREALFLGIMVGTDSEMIPRVQLGSVPFSMQASTVPDGSIGPSKLADAFGSSNQPLFNYVARSAYNPDLLLNTPVDWTRWDMTSIVGESATAAVIYIRVAGSESGAYFSARGADGSLRILMAAGLHQGEYKGYGQLTLALSDQTLEYLLSNDGGASVEAQVYVIGWYEPAKP